MAGRATAIATGLLVGGMSVPFVMVIELFPPELAATAAGVTNAACFTVRVEEPM